jgi:CelD/BcsL family acetyltransferase involved in cellulose biosynthesis
VLRGGEGAWFWKIAYDENFAQASPGMQLTCEATRALLADPTLAWCDSCAAPGQPMVERAWGERRTIVDRLMATQPGLGFAVACRLEAIRRGVIGVARRAKHHLARMRRNA